MKNRVPKKPSGRRALPFYWWRRFRSHRNLPYKASLLSKIRNGDFEYSQFFQEAEWELHWMKEELEEYKKNLLKIIKVKTQSKIKFIWILN